MRRDLRSTDIFLEAKRLSEEHRAGGTGGVWDIADIQRSAKRSRLLFTGTIVGTLDKPRITRICEFDADTGSMQVLISGPNSDGPNSDGPNSARPNSDCHARLSPDGQTIAFLSDRNAASDWQLFFYKPVTQAITAGPHVAGSVDYFEWSPDGRRIAVGVCVHPVEPGDGRSAEDGSRDADALPSWIPDLAPQLFGSVLRQVWILDTDSCVYSHVLDQCGALWEATWLGSDRLAVIRSDDHAEGAWYAADLSLIDLSTGMTRCLYKPKRQIALIKASPSGRHLALIEGLSSDRGHVSGDLRLFDLDRQTSRSLDTSATDVTYLEWRSDNALLLAGHRGLETIVMAVDNVDSDASTVRELWHDALTTTSGSAATLLGLEDPDTFALVSESFFQKPRIAVFEMGVLKNASPHFASSSSHDNDGIAEAITWQAPDGLSIEGWLIRPHSPPPYATILTVHGGPVLHWRPHWLGRTVAALMLLRRGYAIFLPNPRGSSGRGQAFAESVLGDVGGADTADMLSGLDYLVSAGLADASRLGVTGLSYGGFMTCWLTTQDARFKAAIAVGPATNHVSHHLLCDIPQFAALFLQDHYTNLDGLYYSRSPLLHVHKNKTPTMLVCGALDRCTPAEEAIQYHNALAENGVESVVVRYPEESHGVHGAWAEIDFAARSVLWFETHMTDP